MFYRKDTSYQRIDLGSTKKLIGVGLQCNRNAAVFNSVLGNQLVAAYNKFLC